MAKRRNNGITFWDVRDIIKSANSCSREIDLAGIKYWVPARPLGWTSIPARWRGMWMVWTGRADVVTWPGQQ